jgi:hypothetical protein
VCVCVCDGGNEEEVGEAIKEAIDVVCVCVCVCVCMMVGMKRK